MNGLWTFDEVERDDAGRSAQLRTSPTWPELIQQICLSLRAALASGDARFGFDESSRDPYPLRMRNMGSDHSFRYY